MLVLSSCFDKGDCLITNTNIVKVGLRTMKDKKPATVNFVSIAVLGDTVLYQNKSLASVELPVDPAKTEVSYVFVYGVKTDTLSLAYTNQTIVLSPDCGAFPYQRNLSITRSTFGQDSVVVTDQSLLRGVKENVQIFF